MVAVVLVALVLPWAVMATWAPQIPCIMISESQHQCHNLYCHTASEGPHQAKQFHMRFIEREKGKVAAEREGGKKEGEEAEREGSKKQGRKNLTRKNLLSYVTETP